MRAKLCLKGFTVPGRPLALRNCCRCLPDILSVTCWRSLRHPPDITLATLLELNSGQIPTPRQRDCPMVFHPNSNGHAVMMFVDWQFTARDDEYLDPAHYRYREAFIWLTQCTVICR